MQWPDATASAADAAGFEAGSAGSGVDSAAQVPRQAGEYPDSGPGDTGPGDTGPGDTGIAGAVDLMGITDVPGGIDLLCADDPELFFAESPEDVERAKALCRACQVRIACLAGALERREPWGVWGGELFLHGTVVPRKRPRGRPRKTEVAA